MVVEVFVTAFAYLPKRPHHFINDGIESSLTEVEYVPPQMDSFIFDRVSRRGIRIKSPFLYNKLCEIIGYYPSFYGTPAGDLLNLSLRSRSEVNTAVRILEPYGVLMHHFTQIEAVVHGIRPEQGMDEDIQEDQISRLGKEHLNLSICTIFWYLYIIIKSPCQEQLDNPSPRVAFAMLWWIYKPGTSVYIQTSGVVHACIIADIKSNLDDEPPPRPPERPSHYHERSPPPAMAPVPPNYPEYQIPKDDVKYWTLYLWYLDSDGVRIARSQTSCRITVYMGLKEVTSLDACPVSTWDTFDKGERRKKIMTRGRYLLDALQKGFLLARYDGPSNDGLRYVSMCLAGVASSNLSIPSIRELLSSITDEVYSIIKSQLLPLAEMWRIIVRIFVTMMKSSSTKETLEKKSLLRSHKMLYRLCTPVIYAGAPPPPGRYPTHPSTHPRELRRRARYRSERT
jgi:uncharacterized protein DUF7025